MRPLISVPTFSMEKQNFSLCDPMILLDGDTFYLTGTQPPYWEGINDGVHLWSFPDLEHWTDCGNILKHKDFPESFRGIDRFGAPEQYKIKTINIRRTILLCMHEL